MQILNGDSSDLVEQAFAFWFNDHEHIRSPFPSYIQNELKLNSIQTFENWIQNLKEGAEDELNDEMIAEKFEEVLFEHAYKLVLTEDEKATILYPFLPRIGDKLKDHSGIESEVVDRHIIKEEDNSHLKITCKKLENDDTWSTTFELPT